jgi:hypothetical protein
MFENFKNINKIKLGLVLANVLLVFFLILLSNLGVLPFKSIGDFAFFAVLTLIFALYRPGWAFLFFVGTIVLENINLAPKEIGIMVRPYQFFGALTILAILFRWRAKRLNFKFSKLFWADYLIIILTISSFVSAFASQDKTPSFKLAIIFLSFAFLYFLSRTFIQTAEDLKRVVPFFLSSSIIVIFYGIWQNIQFIHGGNSFEIMPGRPNGTFAEADWLGIFLVLFLAVIYVIIFYLNKELSKIFDIINSKLQNPNSKQIPNDKIQKFILYFLYIVLIVVYTLLILAVSRSAWLGAAATTLIFILIILTDLKVKEWRWKLFVKTSLNLLIVGIFSVSFVYFFNLTSFQLFNRAQSTGTGLQKITISCISNDTVIPDKITDIDELAPFGCQHINLENIEKEKSAGHFIQEVFRADPNVNIRSEIYQKSLTEIKTHPIFGIGWGSIGKVLGTDERGSALNSSNIFLEVYLGAGIVGFLSFIAIWLYILSKSIKNLYSSDDNLRRSYNLFVILGWVGLTVANLFNAGILLGFMWMFLGMSMINSKLNNE